MGRRTPTAFGTQQNPKDFENNVKKNNNGKNGNGTGNKSTSNVNTPTYPESGLIETNPGSSTTKPTGGKDPFAGIKPGMSKKEIKEQLKKNR